MISSLLQILDFFYFLYLTFPFGPSTSVLRDFKNKNFCVFRAFRVILIIHFSLKNAMTQETKNKWSVIINAILTTLTALLSAFGLA